MSWRVAGVLALLLALPPLPGVQGAEPAPDAYPAEVEALAADLLASAEMDAWPPRPIQAPAQERLDKAQAALEHGHVNEALERYVGFRVEHAHGHLVDEISKLSTSRSQAVAFNVTDRWLAEGEALADGAREVANGLETDNLSVRGAETALWGAYLIGLGEFHLNLYGERSAADLHRGGELDVAALRSSMVLAVGASTWIAVGAALVSLSPHVAGPHVDDLESRLVTLAERSTSAPPQAQNVDLLPRANATTDSPLLRAGLVLTAQQELRSQEARRLLLTAATGSPASFLEEGLRSDQERLARWTAAGSPLALAAYEETDVDITERLSRSDIAALANTRAFAQAVIEIEEIISPETPELEEEENGAPVPWVPLVAVALVGAALVRARRRG